MRTFIQFLRRHWIISLVVFVGVLFGVYAVFFSTSSTQNTTVGTVQKKITVERGDLRITVSGSGQVEADSQVDLKPVAAGDAIEVTTVAVKNDQEVKKGQTIAILDNQDAWRDVERAELSLRQAKIKARQTSELYPKKTEDDTRERQIAAASVASSELAVFDARDRLADYTIRAPFDGIVTGLTVDSGDTISQTGVLASVITKKLRVAVSLNEVDAAKVKEGNTVNLSFDAFPGLMVSGTLSKLATIGTVEQNVVSYGAEIELAEQPEGLKPGMSASAEIVVAEKSGVLVIPNGALTTKEGKTTVMLASAESGVSGGTREVVTGLSDDTQVEIISGLKEGDQLIISSGAASGGSSSSVSTGQSSSLLNLFRGPTSGNQSRSR